MKKIKVADLRAGQTYTRPRVAIAGLPAGTYTTLGVGEPFTIRVNGAKVPFRGVREYLATRSERDAVFNPVPADLEVEVAT